MCLQANQNLQQTIPNHWLEDKLQVLVTNCSVRLGLDHEEFIYVSPHKTHKIIVFTANKNKQTIPNNWLGRGNEMIQLSYKERLVLSKEYPSKFGAHYSGKTDDHDLLSYSNVTV